MVRIHFLVAGFFAVLTSGCTASFPIDPGPTQDFAPPGTGTYLSFDLTQQSGVPVTVNGRELNLLLLQNESPVLSVNADIADSLELRPFLFGLGTVSFRDGDHVNIGKPFTGRYNIGRGEAEDGIIFVMDEDVHPDYDGMISFGAIPASVFRLQINPAPDATSGQWIEMTFTGRSRDQEDERSYRNLEFSHQLALFQDEISANLKASFYLNLARRVTPNGETQMHESLFARTSPHRGHRVDPPLDLELGPIDQVLAEVEADGSTPGLQSSDAEDAITVFHDNRSVAYGPRLLLGRSYFEGCYEIEVDKSRMTAIEQVVRIRCDETVQTSALSLH